MTCIFIRTSVVLGRLSYGCWNFPILRRPNSYAPLLRRLITPTYHKKQTLCMHSIRELIKNHRRCVLHMPNTNTHAANIVNNLIFILSWIVIGFKGALPYKNLNHYDNSKFSR